MTAEGGRPRSRAEHERVIEQVGQLAGQLAGRSLDASSLREVIVLGGHDHLGRLLG